MEIIEIFVLIEKIRMNLLSSGDSYDSRDLNRALNLIAEAEALTNQSWIDED